MRWLAFFSLMLLGNLAASAADIQALAPEVVGAWRLTFTTPDGVERTPTVVVGRQHDELVAWYIDKGEPEAFKDVRVNDEALELTIVPREKEGKATVKLVAKANGDGQCCGNAVYCLADGETAKWEFTGKRIDSAELNHVAEWKLNFTTPEGEKQEPTIHVFEKGDTRYAWCVSDDYALLAKNLKVEGDKATLTIATKTSEGSKVEVKFQGTIDGSTINGSADYSLEGEQGSFPFSGKQVVN